MVSTIRENLDPDLIVLFGSYATNKARSDSDVDIGVSCSKPLSFEQRLQIIGQLEEIAKRSVDLIDIPHTSIILARQILNHGQTLFEKAPFTRSRLCARVWSLYDDLKRMRAGAERAVLARAQQGRP